jgi:hypothetical protein
MYYNTPEEKNGGIERFYNIKNVRLSVTAVTCHKLDVGALNIGSRSRKTVRRFVQNILKLGCYVSIGITGPCFADKIYEAVS